MIRLTYFFVLAFLLFVFVAGDCNNQCNSDQGHGQCIQNNCVCFYPYLGTDCGIAAVMAPVCYLNTTVCNYWAINGTWIYWRQAAYTVSSGYTGVMWGAVSAMVNGSIHLMNFNGTDSKGNIAPRVDDMWSTKFGKPSNTTDQSVNPADVLGHLATADNQPLLDVWFRRPLNTTFPEHYVVSSKPGTTINMSISYGSTYFEFHGPNATMVSVDLAAVANGNTDSLQSLSGSDITELLIPRHESLSLIDAVVKYRAKAKVVSKASLHSESSSVNDEPTLTLEGLLKSLKARTRS